MDTSDRQRAPGNGGGRESGAVDGVPEAGLVDLHRGDAYGRSFADVYDHWYHGVSDAEATARFVAARCGGAPVLELGVGSGRLAEPLVDLGVRVIGLDASSDMLDRCPRPSATAGSLQLIRADMRALPLAGNIGAVLIAFNTLFNLSSRDEQQRLFLELAPLVGATGAIIVEALDATPLSAGPDRSIGAREVDDDGVVVTAIQVDKVAQTLTGQHLQVDHRGVAVRPWRLCWLTPDQLDELATEAGFRLAERYRSWDGLPFTSGDETHISLYRAARQT